MSSRQSHHKQSESVCVDESSHEEKSFFERVYDVVQQIPQGKVATYSQVAALIGSPRSSRFVGFALHSNPRPGVIPCHRVVFKNGGLAPGFAFGGPEEQYKRLKGEGVEFIDADDATEPRVNLELSQWHQ